LNQEICTGNKEILTAIEEDCMKSIMKMNETILFRWHRKRIDRKSYS